MGTVIQLSTREVFILLGAYAGLVVLFGRVLLAQFEKRMGERFAAMEAARAADKEAAGMQLQAIEQRVASNDTHLADVQRTVDSLRAELPLQYVRREDWIRFGATIDAKLDRLADALHHR